MSRGEQGLLFSSRWGLLLATLGMAVGTGNVWRFPRVAASNGGGEFLVAWVVFLLLWSVPLLVVEFAFGKRARRGPIGAFAAMAGPKTAWMGAWVTFCATAIMCYYSVVAGWCLRFLLGSLTGELRGEGRAKQVWDGFVATPAAGAFHALALTLAVLIVARGVRGIERAARVLMPLLLGLILVLAIRAATLPGAIEGLRFLFHPDWEALGHPRIWLEALTQNAWDTGAGWGLVVAYAVYMRRREDVPLNAHLIGFGNNAISLLAGIMVLCTVFAVRPDAQSEIVGAGNTGLTFEWMPELFARIPLGGFFMTLFFLALSVAALTSLVAMVELATRSLDDLGIPRGKALVAVGMLGLLAGLPSALSREVFANQDWVWGVGLILSGLFFAVAARRYGLDRLREEINADGADLQLPRAWIGVVGILVPVQAVILVLWWLWQARGWDPDGWLDPLAAESVGTVLAQWAVVLVVVIGANRWLVRRLGEGR